MKMGNIWCRHVTWFGNPLVAVQVRGACFLIREDTGDAASGRVGLPSRYLFAPIPVGC
jgi:hypothetical protein